MTKTFNYESEFFYQTEDLCNVMEVEINIVAHEVDYAEYEIESIYDVNAGVFRKLEDFPEKEQLEIEKKAYRLTEENTSEAYMDYMVDMADRYEEQ